MKVEKKQNKHFSSEEISVFCEQIVMLLNGGIPLYDGIYMLYNEMEDKKTKAVLEQLSKYMKENMPLHQALEKVDVFPDYMVHMVKVGEYSGKLEEVMISLQKYYERETSVKNSIRNAVTYPVVLFFMMTVILLTLALKILPLFENMFLELNAEVAFTTKRMMYIGIHAGKVMAVITCVALAVIVFLLLWYKTKTGEKIIRNISKYSLFTRKLSEEISTGNFISCMSLMISSGMNPKESLAMAKEVSNHEKITKKIEACEDNIQSNGSLEKAMSESGLITGMESKMIVVAGKTGTTDVAMAKLSEQYMNKTTEKLSKLSTIIETLLVVSLSVMVGGVLISVMLPLVSMISSIG